MPGRKPLLNAELQSDLDGKELFNIRNLNQIDVHEAGMVYVDPLLPDEIGKIDSHMAFKTLDTAIRATPAGYNIVLRPGTHSYDGILEIKRSRISLIGTGAVIVPTTPNGTAGLLITGSFVTVDGIIFDGGRTGSPTNTGTVIEVNRAANVSLINLVIRAQQGTAIDLADDYSSCIVNNCSITDCLSGVVAGILTDHDINDITISNNTIQNIRANGIAINGNGNVNRIGDVKIIGNDIVDVDGNAGNYSSIRVAQGVIDVIIANNYLSRGFYGVSCNVSKGITVHGNSFAGYDSIMLWFDGCISCTANNNLMDGSNPITGAPQADVGIQMTGQFSVLNDTGPFVVVSNLISGISTNGQFFNIANTNDVIISSNQLTGNAYLSATDYDGLKIDSNVLNIGGTNLAIVLSSVARICAGCTIADNRFKETGSRGRLIGVSTVLGMGDVTIVGNLSTSGATYAQGIYGPTGTSGAREFLHSNSPQSVIRTGGEYDNRNGWVNDNQKTFTSSHVNVPSDSLNKYQVGGSQVVSTRITGWSLSTGGQRRIPFDTTTVTLVQLAEVVNAVVHDLHILTGHGLIGTTATQMPGYYYHYS